jgi:hypothetical protein
LLACSAAMIAAGISLESNPIRAAVIVAV